MTHSFLHQTDSQRWTTYTFSVVLLLAIYRLLVVQWSGIPLDLEEVYYLSWSDRLEFGYFSKPPMIAALLGLVTAWFGESALAIKSVSIILHSAAALVVFALARELYDLKTAVISALAFQLMPIVGVISLFSSTDAPLIFFWALTLYAFVRAVKSPAQLRWWLLTGLFAGLGLLSKYTIGVLAIGLLFYLLSGPQRQLLRSKGLWLGLLVAALVWLPNILWLIEHDFITLNHTKNISGIEGEVGGWSTFGEFFSSQIIVFGPIFFIGMLFWLWRPSVWSDKSSRLLLSASLPLLLLIFMQSYSSEANINWASPAYIGLMIVAVHWMLLHARKWLVVGISLNFLLLSGVYHYHALADLMDIQLTRKTDPYFKRLGWEELGMALRPMLKQHQGVSLISDNRKVLGLMAYHVANGGERPLVRSWNPSGAWRHQYDLYNNVENYPQGEFFFLSYEPVNDAVLERFAEHESKGILRVRIYEDLQLHLYVYWVKDFQGY